MPDCRGSRPSGPAIASSSRAQSAAVRAIGPVWSSVSSIGKTPVYGTRPYVGLRPTAPEKELGIRIDPPWSPPIAMSHSPTATSAALPLEEPPAERFVACGFSTGPVPEVGLPPEKQRWSHTSSPTISPPARGFRQGAGVGVEGGRTLYGRVRAARSNDHRGGGAGSAHAKELPTRIDGLSSHGGPPPRCAGRKSRTK